MDFFDYRGLSAETLEAMCQPDYGMMRVANDSSWTIKAYSMEQFIREYAGIPAYVPLNCYSAHGIDYTSIVHPHEVNNDAALYLCYDAKKHAAYQKASKKPCFIVPAPLPWLRNHHLMEKIPNPQGVLAFFQHTTPEINFFDNVKDVVNSYIDELMLLPDKIFPVCVCLHMHDINKGVHKLFMERGIPVYTAGNAFNPLFYKEFYDLLLNFSYTTSSSIGSYTFYAVEAGIPFFLHGKERLLFNFADKNVPKGAYGDTKSIIQEGIRKTFSMFSQCITDKQRTVVNYFIGKQCQAISPIQLNKMICRAIKR